jgi:hypothetical protein
MIYQTEHSRTASGYCIEGFTDDYGNVIFPCKLGIQLFCARRYYFKGD